MSIPVRLEVKLKNGEMKYPNWYTISYGSNFDDRDRHLTWLKMLNYSEIKTKFCPWFDDIEWIKVKDTDLVFTLEDLKDNEETI